MRKRFQTLARHTGAAVLTALIGLLTATFPPQMITRTAVPARGIEAVSAMQSSSSADARIALTAIALGTTRAAAGAPPRTFPVAQAAAASPPSGLLPIVDHADIHPEQQFIADNAFRSLPAACRNHVTSFYVQYNSTENRGLSGISGVMILTGNVPANEFRALLVHECGHIVDLASMKGTPESGLSAFFDNNEPIFADDPSIGFYAISWATSTQQKKGVSDRDFVSGYAKTDAFEDFAETFAFYALQQKEFKRLATRSPALKAKYNWMAQHVFNGTPQLATGQYVRPAGTIAWDVTKLGYRWLE